MDLALAASGSGYGHTECPQGIPIEFALLSILAAFGAAFGILYVALTQQTMGRRRRRRSAGFEEVEVDDGGQLLSHHHGEEEEEDVAVSAKIADIFMLGELLNPAPKSTRFRNPVGNENKYLSSSWRMIFFIYQCFATLWVLNVFEPLQIQNSFSGEDYQLLGNYPLVVVW